MSADLEIDRYLQPIEVVNYFVSCVRTTNHDLIKHFRPLLVKSSLGPENHVILKKITAQIVIIKRIQGNTSFFTSVKRNFPRKACLSICLLYLLSLCC